MRSPVAMNEAERRFRARADRFKRDLNQIVFRAIDQMVDKAQKDARKKDAAQARAEAKAKVQAERERAKQERVEARAQAKQQREEERARLRAAKAEERRAKAEAKRLEQSRQLELRLDANGRLPSRARAGGPSRVREDSILGAELKASIDLSAEIARGIDGLFGAGVGDSPAPPPKAPSERPLFVHKRARDGRIHALSRGHGESEGAPAAAPAAPANSQQGGSAESH